MKTPLVFLLSLTFLFLLSGSVYVGVIDETMDDMFDKKGGVVSLGCTNTLGSLFTGITSYIINMKDKTIKEINNEPPVKIQDLYGIKIPIK
jgi:hypothetical protein